MFKRLLVLAVALAIFVTTFFIYFHVADARIENGFAREREKYHVENTVLTSDNPPALNTVPPARIPVARRPPRRPIPTPRRSIPTR